MKNRVKAFRKEFNFTQVELSENLVVSQQIINVIENGRYNPSTALSLKLGNALKKSGRDFYP